MADGQLRSVINQLRRLMGRRSGSTLTDDQLLQDFVERRDEASFEVLVWRHATMVLNLCQRVLRDAHEAEDAFQATFLVFARKAGSIGKREALAGWLYKVAYRVALRVRTKTRRGDQAPLDELAARDNADDLVWRDLRPVLDEEIDHLPEKYRTPFVLCHLQGHTNEEAAEQLGCPKGTILSRLARGRERLRARLARRGIALSVAWLSMTLFQKASSAAVPAEFVSSTTKAAIPFAAGKAAAGLVSTPVAALTEGVLRTMLLTKLKTAAVALLTLTVLGTGAGFLAHRALAERPAAGGRESAERGAERAREPAARDEAKATEFAGRVSAVAKDGKSITVAVPPPPPAERGAPPQEPKMVAVKLGDKTVVTYQNVGPDGARPTEGYMVRVRPADNANDAAASVTFQGPVNFRVPDVTGKLSAVAKDGKGITVEVSPGRGRGDDAQEAKTVDLKFNDKTALIFSGVGRDGAKLAEGQQVAAWLEDGPKGSLAGSVHLRATEEVRERGGPAADAAGKIVALAKDGKSFTLEMPVRGGEPTKLDVKLDDKTAMVFFNVGPDGAKLGEGLQAQAWLQAGSKDTAAKLSLTGVAKERWPLVAGRVAAVANGGKTITLEQPPQNRGAEPTRIDIQVTDKTRIAYFGVGPDEAKPTDGYHAQVRLDEGTKAAVEILFSKPGSGERGR
jgi:RNA polymerase sigma factor (sigma-70 family)